MEPSLTSDYSNKCFYDGEKACNPESKSLSILGLSHLGRYVDVVFFQNRLLSLSNQT